MVFKKLLTLLMILVVSKAQNITKLNTDEYINANRRHIADILKDYDNQRTSFHELFEGRINTIDIQADFLMDSLKQASERFDDLELLSGLHQECAEKYKNEIPTKWDVQASLGACTSSAQDQMTSLMSEVIDTRYRLEEYYKGTFENEIDRCINEECLVNVVSNATTYAANNQKAFNKQMDVAKCSANSYIKTVLDCSFTAQSNVVTLISRANTLFDGCVKGADCLSNAGGYCENVLRIASYVVNVTEPIMPNPFYGDNETPKCLLLDIA